MFLAAAAEPGLPMVAFEPGELVAGNADGSGARGLFKTANLKDNTRRIEKGVLMPILNADAPGAGGDPSRASGAV